MVIVLIGDWMAVMDIGLSIGATITTRQYSNAHQFNAYEQSTKSAGLIL